MTWIDSLGKFQRWQEEQARSTNLAGRAALRGRVAGGRNERSRISKLERREALSRRVQKGQRTWTTRVYRQDGRRYEGEFEHGKRKGQGILTWPCGKRYQGTFSNGLQHGRGSLSWPTGHRYEGAFQEDWRDVQGKYSWPNGDQCYGTVTSPCAFLFHVGMSPALASRLTWPTWTLLAIPEKAANQLSQQANQLAGLQQQASDEQALASTKQRFNREYEALLSAFHQHDKELCTASALPSLWFLCLYLTLLLDGGSRWRRGELSHTPFEPERKKDFRRKERRTEKGRISRCFSTFLRVLASLFAKALVLAVFLILLLDISLTAMSLRTVNESNQRVKTALMSQSWQLQSGHHTPNMRPFDVNILCVGKPLASVSICSLFTLLGILSVLAACQYLIISLCCPCNCSRSAPKRLRAVSETKDETDEGKQKKERFWSLEPPSTSQQLKQIDNDLDVPPTDQPTMCAGLPLLRALFTSNNTWHLDILRHNTALPEELILTGCSLRTTGDTYVAEAR
eukprot:g2620.t1